MHPLGVAVLLAAEEPNPIVPIWQELVVGAIAFAVLVAVLAKFVYPRMNATFEARVDAIEGGIARAEQRQAEANALFEEYQQQLADARSEAARIRTDAAAEADSIRQEMLSRAREESDRIITAGRDHLVAERQTIIRELRSDIGSLAVELASRIVGESLADEARQRGTVERFLTELDATPAGRS